MIGTRLAPHRPLMTGENLVEWLYAIAVISLVTAAVCASIMVLDLSRHRQHMWIMNLVWPLTALYAGPLALWAYYRFGRLSKEKNVCELEEPRRRDARQTKTILAGGCRRRDALWQRVHAWRYLR